ncbi:hypothetical protein PENTCL1PPCAC_8229, partial [Pristionchus entomophagus]
AEAKLKQANLMKELEEMKKINELLATTEAGKFYDELKSARKRIEHLEKKAETFMPKASNIHMNKRENIRTSLHTDDPNEMAQFPNPFADSMDNMSTIPNFTRKSFTMKSKEEPVDTTEPIGDNNRISTLHSLGNEMNFMEDDTMNDNVAIENGCDNVMTDHLIVEEGEESIEHTTDALKDSLEDDMTEKGGKKETKIDPTPDRKDSSETVEVEKRRRSSRGVSKPQNHIESLNDSDSEPAVKKLRSDSEKKNDKVGSASDDKNRGMKKLNRTELECPECEFRTQSVCSWYKHLGAKHSTNPTLAGLALLCDCGHESFSCQHFGVCNVANFTVIPKRDGPIRRFNEPTVKCVLCEFFPKTPTGYTNHLRRYHKSKSTLIANGIYLVCACGLEIRTQSNDHGEGCDRRHFSLHKLDEE